MVGQDFVVATLRNALESGQVAPAYLFSGPRGTGKTSTARILARSLNCEKGPTAEPCGVCPACVEIGKGSSPDVIEIDGASNTSVNDVREIKDEVLYAPQGSHKKIYIIDEVHMLSNSAFNALLKTIEEPPPYIVFVFATTEVHKVPATIRSRCQQFRFRLFPHELIREKLSEAATELKREYESDALTWIAREAGGSMRDAYTLFDQVLSFSDAKVTLSGIREKMGLVGLESTAALMEAAADGNRSRALEILDEIVGSGTAVEQLLIELADLLRNLTLLAYGIDKESILGLSPERFPEGPRSQWNAARLESAAAEAYTLYRDIRYSLNPRYELELFVGRLCSLRDRLDSQEILERIESLRRELVTGDWSDGEPHDSAGVQVKKKTLDSYPAPLAHAGTSTGSADEEANRFFSSFRKVRSDNTVESENAATPEEQATPDESGPAADVDIVADGSVPLDDTPPDEPETHVWPETGRPSCEIPVDIGTMPLADRKDVFINHIRKENLTYASALEKAVDWEWSENTLALVFTNPFEATVVRNDTELLRRVAVENGLPPFSVDVRVESPAAEDGDNDEQPRVALVRQVFRGQIVKG